MVIPTTASNASTRIKLVITDELGFVAITGCSVTCACTGSDSAASPFALTACCLAFEFLEVGLVVCRFTAGLATTREERTEVFFFVLGALLVCFAVTFLFAFFDGDTDDLYCWRIDVARVARGNGHQHIQSLNNLAKDTVLVVQMRCGNMCDEEL